MLAELQDHLESIYGYSCKERAERYVVERDAAMKLGASGNAAEELLISQDGDELEVALYLDPTVLRWARDRRGSLASSMSSDFNAFCQVTEGVSHFLYLARAAEEDRTVSLLELEAQAEVDKFASCVMHRWGDGAAEWSQRLWHRLFNRVSYRRGLSAAERWRYAEANRLSKNYCRRLFTHVRSQHLDRLLGELRHMYRIGADAKLQYFAAPAR